MGLSQRFVLSRIRKNGNTSHSVSKSSVSQSVFGIGSQKSSRAPARDHLIDPCASRFETVAAQSSGCDRELSSAALWNCYFYYRPVQRHCSRVWNDAVVGAPRERHRGRI